MDTKILEVARLTERFLTPDSKQSMTHSQVRHFHSLLSDPLLASGYLTCLVVRLISLDSLHGYKAIRSLLDDLLCKQRFDDKAGYRQWLDNVPSGDSSLLAPLYAMRSNVIDTVCFVGWFYQCAVTDTLQTAWRQWQIAFSSYVRSESERMALDLVGSLADLSQSAVTIRDIVQQCCKGFKAGHLLPDFSSCIETQPTGVTVYGSLPYAKLMNVARSASGAEETLKAVVEELEKIEFSEDDERIFPLLQLFCETVMAAPFVDHERYFNAYRAVQPVYLWPLPHCDVARDVMNFIQDEMKCPGIHFRRRLITEHNLEVRHFLSHGDREHTVHILVDMSAAESNTLLSALAHQDSLHEMELQKLVIKHALVSFFGAECNVADIEKCLSLCTPESVEGFCDEVVCCSEQAAQYTSKEKAQDLLADKLGSVMKQLTVRVDKSDKPLSLVPTDTRDKKETIAIALPQPVIECHQFNSKESTSAKSALFDVLFKTDYNQVRSAQRSASSPAVFEDAGRAYSTGSRTSLDSLDSQHTLGGSPPQGMLPEIKEEVERLDDIYKKEKMDEVTRSSSVISRTSFDSTGSSALEGTVEGIEHVLPQRPLQLSLSMPAGSSPSVPEIFVATPTGRTVVQPTFPESSSASERAGEREVSAKHEGKQSASNDADQRLIRLNTYPRLLPEVTLRTICRADQPARKGIISMYSPGKVKAGADKSLLRRSRLRSFDEHERSKPSLIKIVIASPDQGINGIAAAYADIRAKHSSFFEKAEVRFYYLPLDSCSKALELESVLKDFSRKAPSQSNGNGRRRNSSSGSAADRAWTSSDQTKNWLADFIARIDGWHERQVTTALKKQLNLLPQSKEGDLEDTKQVEIEKDAETTRDCTTPFELVQNTIISMCRSARYQLGIKLYNVKIWQHGNDPSTKPSDSFVMVQRLEVLGAGQSRYPNEFSETRNHLSVLQVTGSLVTVDGQQQGPFTLPDRSYWSVTLSNIPRPGDSCIANPETSGLEVTLVEGIHLPLRIGLRGRRHGPKDEKQILHVKEVHVSSQKPFNIVVDDGEPLAVMRLQVKPCVCPVVPPQARSQTVTSGGSNSDDFVYLSRRGYQDCSWRRNQTGGDEEIEFPLMTFWPAAL